MKISILENTFELLPDRALYWIDEDTLIVTDLHLGKSGHFRKSGIAAPAQINQTNIRRLESIVSSSNPGRLLILGDLFHSDINREWFQFEEWRQTHSELEMILVAGNHDSLHPSFYDNADLHVCSELKEREFRFIHDSKDEDIDQSEFLFSGHIHPGVRIKGKGRQSLTLSCFYQMSQQMILPAFGEFTGLYILPEKEAEDIFPIAEGEIFQLNHVN